MDYNVLVAEIQTAKMADHTHPLPGSSQTWLILQGILPIVPVDKI
jgi:hypothetical protein